MKKRPSWFSVSLIFVVVAFAFSGLHETVSGKYVKYQTGAGIVDGKLNVHLVAHTHDDVGWLKTVDQYYIGSNNSIQGACVENVLDSLRQSLQLDPSRKFIYAEMAFFQRWWDTQSPERQEQMRKLVVDGRLEFVNGGWCMHDEAASHYIDMIDQTTLGHHYIKEQFNKTPRAGWQIDPFGHSAVQAYLLGVEVGFDSVHFARIDYQDRAQRYNTKSLEVVWRGSRTFGSTSQIFANTFPRHYSPPDGFYFEVSDTSAIPVQDNPLLEDYNVQQRVNDFISAALTQANITRTNHIMWTMGDDFEYQYAETWFKQMDKFIHYVNQDGRVNALYSTPSIYVDAKNAAGESWPLKTDDYFPYADGPNAFWTGYFTSRPALKRYIRTLSGYYVATRQLEYLVGKTPTGPSSFPLGDAMGIAQHHDAVSGTAQQHTTNDYEKRLYIGSSQAEAVVSRGLSCLTSNVTGDKCATLNTTFTQCQLFNISYCPPTEEDIPDGMSLVVVAYNPLGWNRTDIIKIPVNDPNVIVQDSSGKAIEAQLISLDNVTINLRNFYTEAYLGLPSTTAPKYWLLFQATVPPLGWSTYFISKSKSKGETSFSTTVITLNETIEVGPGDLKLTYSTSSGQLVRMHNSRTGVDIPIQQSYLWYASSEAGDQASGAYIFRPDSNTPHIVSRNVSLTIIRGPVVDEVHQQFNSWIYQVTRVYKDKEHAEVEYTIGPIPIDDSIGKEVITRMTANMATNAEYFTDSNGRDFLKRIRNFREDWSLQVTQPVAGNYYPLNLGIYITDKKSEFSVLVDRATGAASINDGQVELMLHRRMLADDGRGVGEALDENVCVNNSQTCQGLTVRGNYYIGIHPLQGGSKWRRTTGQEIFSPLVLAFTHENLNTWKASHLSTSTTIDPSYSLPPNVALITLQELDDGSVLLRLAHLYEAGEDADYSTLAKVELHKIFKGKQIKGLEEMSLSANQLKSSIKKKTWKVEGESGKEPSSPPIRGAEVDPTTLIVELGPMEIRTFLLTF